MFMHLLQAIMRDVLYILECTNVFPQELLIFKIKIYTAVKKKNCRISIQAFAHKNVNGSTHTKKRQIH